MHEASLYVNTSWIKFMPDTSAAVFLFPRFLLYFKQFIFIWKEFILILYLLNPYFIQDLFLLENKLHILYMIYFTLICFSSNNSRPHFCFCQILKVILGTSMSLLSLPGFVTEFTENQLWILHHQTKRTQRNIETGKMKSTQQCKFWNVRCVG